MTAWSPWARIGVELRVAARANLLLPRLPCLSIAASCSIGRDEAASVDIERGIDDEQRD
jgi:hypothetical protein